ncbi:MAG: FAD-binding oxidoreductase [Phycisphaerales bacterium]
MQPPASSITEAALPGHPHLPEARMHLVRPTHPATATITATRICTAGGRKAAGIVRHIELDISRTPIAGNFLVGQSFGVLPPGEDSRGKSHALRLYSIASPSFGEDGAGNVLATTVKRTIAERQPQNERDDPDDHCLFMGVASNFLCDLRVGDELAITGPQGKRFLLPSQPEKHDYIFLATGTGIAPFRGMVMELLTNPRGAVPSSIHLVMGAPYRSDLLYDDELRALAAAHPNFIYHTAISREYQPHSPHGEYVHQVFSNRRDCFHPMLLSDRTLIYVCGILGMQFGIYREIIAAGAADAFLSISNDLDPAHAAAWSGDDVKRKVRPTARMMLEVY